MTDRTSAETTAHELAADWSWMLTAGGFTVGRGRTVWEEARYLAQSRSARVRIGRVETTREGVRQYIRWVDPDTACRLVEVAT
jgi:hypothetical protein